MAVALIQRWRIALVIWTVVIFCTVPHVQSVWLNLPSTGTKCVSEEIQSHIVVLADYYVVVDDKYIAENHAHNITVSAKVTSPYSNTLHEKENVTQGQFAFTTTEAGNYLACFWVSEDIHPDGVTSLSLDWRTGIATKDWESVAKKDKIEGVELELRKLEGLVDSIHMNLNYLKSREAEMREVSEVTNARVAWFSIMSLGTSILVSVWQLWYLKRYFQKKKLI